MVTSGCCSYYITYSAADLMFFQPDVASLFFNLIYINAEMQLIFNSEMHPAVASTDEVRVLKGELIVLVGLTLVL